MVIKIKHKMRTILILFFIILISSCSTQEMVTDSVYDTTNDNTDQIDYYSYNDITYNYPQWYNYTRFGFGVNIMNGPYYHPYWGWVNGYGNWISYGYYNPWNSGIYNPNPCGYYGYGNPLYVQGCLCYGNYNSLYRHRSSFGNFRLTTQPNPNAIRSPIISETKGRYQPHANDKIKNLPIDRRLTTQPRVINPQDRNGGSRPPPPTPRPAPDRQPTKQSR